jgi:hypothetical protein
MTQQTRNTDARKLVPFDFLVNCLLKETQRYRKRETYHKYYKSEYILGLDGAIAILEHGRWEQRQRLWIG